MICYGIANRNVMVKQLLEQVQADLADFLNTKNISSPDVLIERAANSEFGDYTTNVAMRYAKTCSMSPLALAEEIVNFLETKSVSGIEKVVAVKPGFINFFFSPEVKVSTANAALSNQAFKKNASLSGQKWVVEHTSPNPNKAMHLGHLRNNLVGMGIVRILNWNGAEVVAEAVYNDRGIAIAKLMYGFLAHMKKNAEAETNIAYWTSHQSEWFTPEEKEMKADRFVAECYVLAEKDIASNPEIENQVRKMVVDWEAGDELVRQLWQHVLNFSYSGINQTLTRLGSHWDKIWYEHEHYQAGKDYVSKGLEQGIFTKLEDGAVLTNLESFKIPDTILLKNDGTSLYITQDIALTDLKRKTHQADKMVWVIGPDQSLAMRQLFAVCEQLGIGKVSDFNHVTYGYVGLKADDGGFQKMSSRAGTVVLIDDVIDEVKSVIKQRFVEEERHEPSKQDELSEKLALAAVKFSFLKSDRSQDMTFDVSQSVDVHGDSGIYVMYSYVRTQSILRKAARVLSEEISAPEVLGEEAELLRTLFYFNEVLEKSAKDLSVHHVAQYLLEVSSEFNRWYAKETILDGSDKEAYRLAIVKTVGDCLKSGMEILGIDVVDEM